MSWTSATVEVPSKSLTLYLLVLQKRKETMFMYTNTRRESLSILKTKHYSVTYFDRESNYGYQISPINANCWQILPNKLQHLFEFSLSFVCYSKITSVSHHLTQLKKSPWGCWRALLPSTPFTRWLLILSFLTETYPLSNVPVKIRNTLLQCDKSCLCLP